MPSCSCFYTFKLWTNVLFYVDGVPLFDKTTQQQMQRSDPLCCSSVACSVAAVAAAEFKISRSKTTQQQTQRSDPLLQLCCMLCCSCCSNRVQDLEIQDHTAAHAEVRSSRSLRSLVFMYQSCNRAATELQQLQQSSRSSTRLQLCDML
jgi:hypothetical protein